MDPLQENEAIQQFMKLLEENNRQGQAADLSALMWYLDGMERQFDAVLHELAAVKEELAQVTERQAPSKPFLAGMVEGLEKKVEQVRDRLTAFRDKIMECVKGGLERFKDAGVSALDSAVTAMGVKKGLEHLQEGLQSSLSGVKRALEKAEDMGRELRSAGAHLKNAGRAMTGKETQTVAVGPEGRFQSAVLAPMRTTQRLLTGMNNATLAAIGGTEHLEQSADMARGRRQERAAQKPGKRLEKKPSIRRELSRCRAKANAVVAPVPENIRKPPEAAR